MIAYPLLKNTANPGKVVPRRASSAAPHLLWPSRQVKYRFVLET